MVKLGIKKYYRQFFFFLLAVHFFFLLRIMFTAWPEMLLWPYLMVKGLLPYKDIAIAHTPLMLVDLSIFYKLFGVGITQLKIFTWLLILLADGVLFYVVKKLWNVKVALYSLVAFIFWQLFYDGNGLWFDLYMGVLAFVSFYFVKEKKYGWAGIAWGLAFISKQTAVWFLIPIFYSLFRDFTGTRARKFIVGGLMVASLMSFLLYIFNIWPAFVNWAVKFGVFTLPRAQGQINYPSIRQIAVSLFPFAVFLSLLLKKRKEALSLGLWSFAGILGAYPRFELFHFQPAVFYLAISSGLVFSGLVKNKFIKALLVLYVALSIVLFGRFLTRNWNKGVRFYDKTVKQVSQKVSALTNSGQYIYVLNYWDNIYALTDTRPAIDPWVPYLPWYITQKGTEDKMLEGLFKTSPKIIVRGDFTQTGLSSFKAEKLVDFVSKNYTVSEKIDNVEILTRNND